QVAGYDWVPAPIFVSPLCWTRGAGLSPAESLAGDEQGQPVQRQLKLSGHAPLELRCGCPGIVRNPAWPEFLVHHFRPRYLRYYPHSAILDLETSDRICRQC